MIGTAALEGPRIRHATWRATSPAASSSRSTRATAWSRRDGWADVSDVPVADLARRFEDAGVAALLFTDVGRDGMLKGCNVEATVALARAVDIPVIASGGVDGHRRHPHARAPRAATGSKA